MVCELRRTGFRKRARRYLLLARRTIARKRSRLGRSRRIAHRRAVSRHAAGRLVITRAGGMQLVDHLLNELAHGVRAVRCSAARFRRGSTETVWVVSAGRADAAVAVAAWAVGRAWQTDRKSEYENQNGFSYRTHGPPTFQKEECFARQLTMLLRAGSRQHGLDLL